MKEFKGCRKLVEAKTDVFDYFHSQLSDNATGNGIPYLPIKLETVGSKGEGLGFLSNDVDILAIYDKNVASVCFPFLNINLTESMFVIDTHDCHNGYCRLKFHRGNRSAATSSYDPRDILRTNRDIFLRNSINSILLEIQQERNIGNDSSIHGPALTNDRLRCDWVFALQCTNPHHLITSYLNRKRNWPNVDVLVQLKNLQYTVVTAHHPNSNDPTLDFRISFASAEKYLIRHFSDNQFACYYFLKLIKAQIEKDVCVPNNTLKSYYVKTAFLWICEKLESDLWSDEKFLLCVSVSVSFLQHCFRIRMLPQLFIPENNLIDHMQPDDCNKIADALGKYVVPQAPRMFLRCICDDRFDGHFDMVMSRPRRNMQHEIQKLLIETSSSKISIEHIPGLMEAGTLSLTLGELAMKDDGIVYQTLAATVLKLKNIVTPDMIACIRSLLYRLFANVLHRSPSLRTVSKQAESLYKEGIPLTYPVSQFDDRGLSGRTNLALFYYLQGNLSNAMHVLCEVEKILYDADSKCAVAITFVPNDLERTYRDKFLTEMVAKFGTYLEQMPVKCNVVALYVFLKCIEYLCSKDDIRSQSNRLGQIRRCILFNAKQLVHFDTDTRVYTSLVLEAAKTVTMDLSNRILN
ncbi:Cyclic GMP-AMP synthase [Mizuhopecten yessoensis]|uniref:Cyclic GMP-AMP synthase n=1 Tax=Mizuhopecten yessoensis TaxID=6573 RepID=A0A210Q7P0_MIZYE|nr:Cyclic GMP-AMP synthase [Mizuhopecten yessoensis]